MSRDKSFLDGPSPFDHSRDMMIQGGVGLGVGLVGTALTVLLLGVIWLLLVGIGIVGLFRLLQGVGYWLMHR